jgi:hypothetical protein
MTMTTRLLFTMTSRCAAAAVTRVVLALALLVSGAPVTTFASDSSKPWTTVGSAGTVDAQDLSIFTTNDRNISMNAAQFPATLDVRYNIVAVDGLVPEFGADGIFMKARYRDRGSNGQLVLRLKQYNLNTGTTTTLVTFDSNTAAQSTSAQVRQVSTDPCLHVAFDFINNAYFVDAQLIQTSAATLTDLPPLLAIIQVGASSDLCGPK